MSSHDKPSLKVDWCSYDAAKYSVQHWHYSRSLPCFKTARLGVWEANRFIGAVVFAWGANRHLAGEYKLKMTECAELCRVALDKHVTPVSRILSIAIRMLKHEMPGIRLLVSYADLNQGHLGRIYQASNWVYVGTTGHEAGIMLNGKLTHRRTINSKYGSSDIEWLRKRIDTCAKRYEGKPKFKYLLPLDKQIAERVKALSKSFPNAPQAETSLRQTIQSGEAGEAPSAALQFISSWLASDWSYSRKLFPSSPALQFCGIHGIRAVCHKPARELGLQLHSMEVSSAKDFESAFKEATKARSDALAVTQLALATSNRKQIADLATINRLPAIYPREDFVESGGLMSYGPDETERYQRSAILVDKILKGAKPADLPVEQPTKFELVINLKTAKQHGLTIPAIMLTRANKVIK